MTVWHRTKAKINRFLDNPLPEACTTHEPTCPLPYEITEMIIAHLTHDPRTLKACSLTCRSWYIVAAPYIHHTLILARGVTHSGLKPLSKLRKRGLMPFIQEIRVEQPRGAVNWFVPRAFGRRSLRYFSAFAKVHTLRLQGLKIYRFFPHVERYFGQFSPTLRSIVLADPHCSPRQLSHFLSLFSNLDDVKIWGLDTDIPNVTALDAMLVPSSTLKLRGRLALGVFNWVETWTHLIASCGGLRFRHMELCTSVYSTPPLLEACAETLETLRFYATDRSQSKSFCISGLPTDSSSLRTVTHSLSFPEFNLSRLCALRSLQVADLTNNHDTTQDQNHAILMEVFSTITSPVFSELVIILVGDEIICLPREAMMFQTLRKMYEVRPFKLVFSFEGPPPVPREGRSVPAGVRRKLEKTLESVATKGFLDFLDSPPTIRVATRVRHDEWDFPDFD